MQIEDIMMQNRNYFLLESNHKIIPSLRSHLPNWLSWKEDAHGLQPKDISLFAGMYFCKAFKEIFHFFKNWKYIWPKMELKNGSFNKFIFVTLYLISMEHFFKYPARGRGELLKTFIWHLQFSFAYVKYKWTTKI